MFVFVPAVEGEAVAISCSGYSQEVSVSNLIHYWRLPNERHTSRQCNSDPWRCILRSYPQTDAQLQVWQPENETVEKVERSIDNWHPSERLMNWKRKKFSSSVLSGTAQLEQNASLFFLPPCDFFTRLFLPKLFSIVYTGATIIEIIKKQCKQSVSDSCFIAATLL